MSTFRINRDVKDRQMTIYNHRTKWKIISNNAESCKMVLYNNSCKSLSVFEGRELIPSPSVVRESSSDNSIFPCTTSTRSNIAPQINQSRCPLCHQSFSPESTSVPVDISSIGSEEDGLNSSLPSYVSGDYFLLLEKHLERERITDGHFARNRQETNGRNLFNDTLGYSMEDDNEEDDLDSSREEYRNSKDSQQTSSSSPLSMDSLNSGYYKRFFVQDRKIGSGGYGAVFLCRHVINSIELGWFAVKKVPVGDNEPWLSKVLQEVKALERLKKHPNIVNYQHSWLEFDKCADFGPEIPCLFILMEYANGFVHLSRYQVDDHG